MMEAAVLPLNSTQPLLIGGQLQTPNANSVLSVMSPGVQSSPVGECYLLEAGQLNLVEQAAVRGFETFRHCTVIDRAAILNRLASLLEMHAEALARLITQEAGKPIKLSRHEVQRAVGVCRGYAARLHEDHGQIWQLEEGRQGQVRRFPLGPVLAITPYNFPLNLVVHKLAPAIAAGCSITIKPAPKTPLTALALGKLAVEAGYEAISVIPASNELSEALVRSPAFAKLTFTGSAQVGWHLRTMAGNKSVTLELGGNAAVIVDELTQPVEDIASRIAFGAFAYAGQVCISVQRLLVRESLREILQPAMVQATRAIKVGEPMDPQTDVGPMIDMESVKRSRNLIKDALSAGANVVYGGNTFNAMTMNPTILDRTTPDMQVNVQECFAPLMTLSTYEDFAAAIAQVNQSRYGLQAGVYTNDRTKIEQAYQDLQVGGVMINDVPTYRADLLPYGGIKDSGLGREGIVCGMDEMTYLKTLVVR